MVYYIPWKVESGFIEVDLIMAPFMPWKIEFQFAEKASRRKPFLYHRHFALTGAEYTPVIFFPFSSRRKDFILYQ